MDKVPVSDLCDKHNLSPTVQHYNRGTGKPYRQPDVMRETGTCKRQIEYSDLYEIFDEETYRGACSEPGPVWQPEEISRNSILAEKFQYYLNEAEQQQAAIKNMPELTPDEVNRLSLSIPPCMKTLSRLTSCAKGNTFNDIAMQLTASGMVDFNHLNLI